MNIKHTNYLQAVLDRDGELIPSKIVLDAENANSPIHDLFEWDNNIAAHQHRLQTARRALKRFSVTIENAEDKIIHVPPPERVGEGAYKQIKAVVTMQSELDRVYIDAIKRLNSAKEGVALLEAVISGTEDESITLLALAARSIETAREAVAKIH